MASKRNHYLLSTEAWTEEELNAEINEYGFGGASVGDTMRRNEAEDEITWRRNKGYLGMTPQEIEDDLIDLGKIDKRYLIS